MNVNLVASTTATPEMYQRIGETEMGARERGAFDDDPNVPPPAWVEDSELLAEAAGRVCYDSFGLPNPATRENAAYLANIKDQRHFSVLEHASFTFHVEGVSRALLAELTRHRHLSFSVRSQRYCDEWSSHIVMPRVLAEHASHSAVADAMEQVRALHARAGDVYQNVQAALKAAGVDKRKVRNDAARYVLPEGTCTEFYVSGNARAWLEFLDKRDSPHAAEEIRMMAQKVRDLLTGVAPNVFTST